MFANGHELRGIGIPKTVDNDLYGTDHTPGFASAGRYNALSVMQGGQLARDMKQVDQFVVFQTIGCDAGWLAATTACARKRPDDAPHLIYCPERSFNAEEFIADAKACIEKHGWVSVVVSEGLKYENGLPVSAAQSKDAFNNTEFGAMGGASVGLNVHKMLREATGLRGEFQIVESLNISAIDRATPDDLEEAYQCGIHALEKAVQGESGYMVCMGRVSNSPYKIEFKLAPLSDVAIRAKSMPEDNINDRGNDITGKALDYLKPLIGELPHYVTLEPIYVEV